MTNFSTVARAAPAAPLLTALHTYTHTHTRTYTCTHTHIHTHIHTHTHAHTHTYTHTCTCTHMHMHTHTCTQHTHTHAHAHAHTCTHTHTHTHVHTHTHTQFSDYIDQIPHYRKLLKEPQSFWVDMVKKYFVDAPHVAVSGKSSMKYPISFKGSHFSHFKVTRSPLSSGGGKPQHRAGCQNVSRGEGEGG